MGWGCKIISLSLLKKASIHFKSQSQRHGCDKGDKAEGSQAQGAFLTFHTES